MSKDAKRGNDAGKRYKERTPETIDRHVETRIFWGCQSGVCKRAAHFTS